MPHTLTRSLFSVLRQRDDEERRAREVRDQAGFFRRFGRQDNAIGRAAGELFPLGLTYERQRLEDPSLRPNKFVLRLQELAFRGELTQPPPGMEQRGVPAEEKGFPPLRAISGPGLGIRFAGGPPETEEAAMQQAVRQQAGLAEAVRERQQGLPTIDPVSGLLQPAPSESDRLEAARVQAGIEEIAADVRRNLELGVFTEEEAEAAFQSQVNELQRGNIRASGQGPFGIPLGPLGADVPTDPSPLGGVRSLLSPQFKVPSEETLSPLGPAAGPVHRELTALATPLGFSTAIGLPLALGPRLAAAELGAGSLGATGLGTLGEVADVPEPVQIGLEVGGGLLPAGALGATRRIPVPQPARVAEEAAEALPDVTRPAVREGAEAAEEVAEEVAPTAAEKLTDILKRTTRPARREMEALKSAELKKRVGAGAAILERGEGEEAFIRATAQLKGEFPKVAGVPRQELTPDDIFQLYEVVNKKPGELFLTRTRVGSSLNKVLSGDVPGGADIALMERFFGKELGKELRSGTPLGKRVFTNILSGANAIRAVQTAFDFSAPFRQGILLIGHPKEFFSNMKPMFRAFSNDEYFKQSMAELATGPQAERRAAANLYQADITPPKGQGALAEMSAREEAFMSNLVDRIPGVRRSQNAFILYLNKLRADVFDNTVAGWDRLGTTTPDLEEDLARMVNIFTGRGDLGAIDDFVPVLNQAFFSARLLASRVQAPTLLFRGSKEVRLLAARDLASFIGFGMGIIGLAAAAAEAFERQTGKEADFKVEMDPRSTDFGKIRVGQTRLDFWGGFQPIARYAAQIATGQRKTAMGDVIPADRLSSFSRFLRSKLSPQAGLAVDVAQGETFLGDELTTDPTSLKEQAFNRLTPLFIQDFTEAITEGNAASPFMTIPAAFGASAMTYRTFTEETAAKIAEDFETGRLDIQRYDELPTRLGDLLPSDKEIFNAAHPEVEEHISQFDRGEDETSRFFQQIEVGKERLRGELDRIDQSARQGQFGDMGEQDARSTFWDSVGKQEDRYTGVIINAEDQFPAATEGLADRGPTGRISRLIREYRELQDRHPVRETEEQWEAYEVDLNGNFTEQEVKLVRAELDIGDHDVQRAWAELNDILGGTGYYDVPEGRGQARQRERMRRQSPELDAALFLLGRVSTLKTPAARNIVAQRSQEIWGGAATPAPTGPFSPLQPGGFDSLQPGGFEGLQPLGVP